LLANRALLTRAGSGLAGPIRPL